MIQHFFFYSGQIPIAVNVIKLSSAPGLYLNIIKCELMAVKDCDLTSISNIPVKNSVTYLSFIIVKD